jgi:hypothetical protein
MGASTIRILHSRCSACSGTGREAFPLAPSSSHYLSRQNHPIYPRPTLRTMLPLVHLMSRKVSALLARYERDG